MGCSSECMTKMNTVIVTLTKINVLLVRWFPEDKTNQDEGFHKFLTIYFNGSATCYSFCMFCSEVTVLSSVPLASSNFLMDKVLMYKNVCIALYTDM